MKNNLAFKVSGIIFVLVAAAHLSRILFQFPVIIGNYYLPIRYSVIIGVVVLLLAIWVFKSIK